MRLTIKGSEISVTESGKGRTEQNDCVVLEDELVQCSKEEVVTMGNSVETLGVDLRRKKCKVRFSLIERNKLFQKCYMKVEG